MSSLVLPPRFLLVLLLHPHASLYSNMILSCSVEDRLWVMSLQNGCPYGFGQEAPEFFQKIAISSSTGTGNGFVRGAIDIYHIVLHF